MDVKVPWGALKAKVAELEKNGATLKDLSKEEAIAFSNLVDFTKEPEFEEANYVGELLEFFQAGRRSSPSFEFQGPLDIPVKGVPQLRWYCICVLPGYDSIVPNDQFDVDGETPISFRAKKTAKSYAAMEALKLVKGHPIPRQSRIAQSPNEPATNLAVTPCHERIAALVIELGMSMPRFEAHEHLPATGLFDCRAIFDALTDVPGHIGNVQNIEGREQAVLESAKAVEHWMKLKLYERSELLKSTFA